MLEHFRELGRRCLDRHCLAKCLDTEKLVPGQLHRPAGVGFLDHDGIRWLRCLEARY